MAHDSRPMMNRHTRFVQTNLVSNGVVPTPVTDPKLLNAWGIVAGPTSPWWINDNGSGMATVYNGSGTKLSIEVTIAPPAGSPAGTLATPTGIVFNGHTSEFHVGPSAPAFFIFATEDGTISGWNPTVDPSHSVLEVDHSTQVNPNGSTGAVYKGLATASNGSADFLFAANFRARTVDVFDSSFHQVTLPSGAFTDRRIPSRFAPFGIAAVTPPGSSQTFLVVTFAKQDADKKDDVAGSGNGFVDIFDTSGNLVGRVASRGPLNSPWGVALAPSQFGRFSADLLIGNFGNGRINAFRFPTGQSHVFRPAGHLTKPNGRPIRIDRLWGIAFGNGGSAGPTNTLFFTAGPNDEADGLFGTLTMASA